MRASVGVRSNPKARPYSVTSSTSGRLSMDVVLRFRYQSSPGTGASCEPDEARGSPRREAYSLYVERRGRPSNEVWRSKLPQYRRCYNRGMATLTDATKKSLRREMEGIVGADAVLSDPDELLVYESDGLTLFRAVADFIVFPTSAEQVSALVKLAKI